MGNGNQKAGMGGGTTRILLVEDEPNLRFSLGYILGKAGFSVEGVGSGEEALEFVRGRVPELVLLDINLPGMDGFETCRRLRMEPRLANTLVVMLSGRVEAGDIVRGLEGLADDYITKPFQPEVLLARIGALLRRRERALPGRPRVLVFGPLVLEPDAFLATLEGRPLDLTKTEFDILVLLARNPGRVLSRESILEEIRGVGVTLSDRVVDFQVFGLRKKLGPLAALIQTIRGVGYRFEPGGGTDRTPPDA
jgi:two-component system phosphate regulon response regulator PhoB